MENGTDSNTRDLESFEAARAQLTKLIAGNKAAFDELRRLVEIYNSQANRLRDIVKSMAKEDGKKHYLGPFVADPKHEVSYDIKALKEILTESEWDMVVNVEYSINKDGQQALSKLEEKYPQLKNLKGDRIYKVLSPGPKSIDISELNSLG